MYFFHYYNYATSFPFKQPQLYFFLHRYLSYVLYLLYCNFINWKYADVLNQTLIHYIFNFFFWWIIIRNYAIVMLYLQKRNILAWEAFLTNSVHITFRRIQTGNCSEKKHFLFHPQTPHIRRHFDKKRRHKDYLHLLKKRSNFKI